jgi:hypothetical protein
MQIWRMPKDSSLKFCGVNMQDTCCDEQNIKGQPKLAQQIALNMIILFVMQL